MTLNCVRGWQGFLAGCLVLLAGVVPGWGLTEAEGLMFKAAASGDREFLAKGLSEVDPDVKNSSGLTLMMVAAQAGHFDCLQQLCWAGADARIKSPAGKMAKEYLDRSHPDYIRMNLILRCYAYVREMGVQKERCEIPHLVVVSDNYVEYDHPYLRGCYRPNQKEKDGKAGVDDDGNGLVDDIYGWNFKHNRPARPAMLALDQSPETQKKLSELVQAVEEVLDLPNGPEKGKYIDLLSRSYQNPLAEGIGLDTLGTVGLDLNDLNYYQMLTTASHGTHVAGTIVDFSDEKAELFCFTHGVYRAEQASILYDASGTISLAQQCDSYGEFLQKVIEKGRERSLDYGKRVSGYLKSIGAGVINGSWGRNMAGFEANAERLKAIYEEHGKNPDTIATLSNVPGLDLINDLPLELAVADAALFALIIHENPDVLFVMAAGNSGEDNDETLPSPVYLSQFFPNMITIASHDGTGQMSDFSCYGATSVQLAATGEKVHSALLSGIEGKMQGTSMASPAVAGVAALIRANHPKLRASDVRRILEATAKPHESLKGKIATEGIMDKEAAVKLAMDWSGPNVAQLGDRKRGSFLPARPKQEEKPGKEVVLQPVQEAPKGAKLRISSVAGFNPAWRVVMSAGTGYAQQAHSGVQTSFPLDWMQEKWGEGYRITDLAGDHSAWNVVMSTDVPGEQALVGFDFDVTQIAKRQDQGFRITSIGGWDDQWIIAMNTETGWGKQRYTLPTPMTSSRREWISARWNEGYRITTVAGDDAPDNEKDGWILVMTQNSGLQEQTIVGPGDWPWTTIEAKLKEGFAVTSLAGTTGRWLVVLSKGTNLKGQEMSTPGDYPGAWIKERW